MTTASAISADAASADSALLLTPRLSTFGPSLRLRDPGMVNARLSWWQYAVRVVVTTIVAVVALAIPVSGVVFAADQLHGPIESVHTQVVPGTTGGQAPAGPVVEARIASAHR